MGLKLQCAEKKTKNQQEASNLEIKWLKQTKKLFRLVQKCYTITVQ